MRKLLIVAGVVMALIVGSLIYLMGQSKLDTLDSQKLTTTKQVPTSPSAGKYLNYHEKLIASTPGIKVLFFHAPWCPQCRQLESEIQAGPLPENTTIFKVDYDSNQALRQKYGVTLQTTLIRVDDHGDMIEKYVAYDDPTLNSIKQSIL